MITVFETWDQLMKQVGTLNEEDLRESINYEVSTYKRKNVISRMHQRYVKLKAKRERQLLIDGEMLL
jgi:hypothetical protein